MCMLVCGLDISWIFVSFFLFLVCLSLFFCLLFFVFLRRCIIWLSRRWKLGVRVRFFVLWLML